MIHILHSMNWSFWCFTVKQVLRDLIELVPSVNFINRMIQHLNVYNGLLNLIEIMWMCFNVKYLTFWLPEWNSFLLNPIELVCIVYTSPGWMIHLFFVHISNLTRVVILFCDWRVLFKIFTFLCYVSIRIWIILQLVFRKTFIIITLVAFCFISMIFWCEIFWIKWTILIREAWLFIIKCFISFYIHSLFLINILIISIPDCIQSNICRGRSQ